MKCPRCGLIVTDEIPKCKGCGFSIDDLDKKIKNIPKRTGFVNDFADILREEKASIEEYLSKFYEEYGVELVLAIVKTAKPVKPSEYVFWLFNKWQIGGEMHAGIMLLLALSERRIESEVGYFLEPIISDVESGEVLDEYVVPLLKSGKITDALWEGVKKLVEIIKKAAEEDISEKLSDQE